MTDIKFKFSALRLSRIRGQVRELSSKFHVCDDILHKHAVSSIKTYQWDQQKDQETISIIFPPRGHSNAFSGHDCFSQRSLVTILKCACVSNENIFHWLLSLPESIFCILEFSVGKEVEFLPNRSLKMSSEVQQQIQQDWENREFIEIVSQGIKKIAEFLNDFGEQKWRQHDMQGSIYILAYIFHYCSLHQEKFKWEC